MVLLAATVYEHIRHTLGNSPTTPMSSEGIANDAGQYLVSLHRWNWLLRPPVSLNFLAPISFTAATWTEATKTITLAAAFTNYTFKPADRVLITAGSTGVRLGSYEIASKTSANAITTVNSITSNGSNLTGVAGTISFPYTTDLPAEFAELEAYEASASTQSFKLTTLQQILDYRTRAVAPDNSILWGAIEWVAAIPSNSPPTPPTPRIALYPTPTAFLLNALQIQYRAGWTALGDDANFVAIPPWIEPLYVQCVRAYARGYEEEDEDSLSVRLVAALGTLLPAAIRRDGMIQPSYGKMRGGAIQTHSGGYAINSVPLGGVNLA